MPPDWTLAEMHAVKFFKICDMLFYYFIIKKKKSRRVRPDFDADFVDKEHKKHVFLNNKNFYKKYNIIKA